MPANYLNLNSKITLLRMAIGDRSDAQFLSAKDKATWLIEELKNSKSTDKKFN